jgi:phage shock protein PspC (stress-responsive transcriptional regulator)
MKQLYRPRSNRVFAGVCSGIGEYIGIDPVFVRLGFIFAFFSGAGFFAYIVLCFLMPSENRISTPNVRQVYVRRKPHQTVDIPVNKRKRKNDEDDVIHYARPIHDDFYDTK